MSLPAKCRKLNTNIGLVGCLVHGEAGVPVRSHQRTTLAYGDGVKTGADLGEYGCHGDYEIECGLQYLSLVIPTVLVEPVSVVVGVQQIEEIESLGIEGLKGRCRSVSGCRCWDFVERSRCRLH